MGGGGSSLVGKNVFDFCAAQDLFLGGESYAGFFPLAKLLVSCKKSFLTPDLCQCRI